MSTHVERQRGGRGARQRILDAAVRLFYVDGINATGVERLAEEASVSKRTLYQHFPSKEAVVEEYLRYVRQGYGDPVNPDPAAGKRSPKSRILALYEVPPSSGGPMRGCPFHNAAVEAAGGMPEVHDIVEAHKRSFVDALVALTREAGAVNPKLLGSQLAILFEGAAAMSTSLDDPTPWAHAKKAAQTLLDEAVSSGSR